MTSEEIRKVSEVLSMAAGTAKADYEICRNDFGEDHYLTRDYKKNLDNIEEAAEIVRQEEVRIWAEAMKVDA